MEVTSGNLYDFPRYYDLVFGSDWKAEFDFLTACFDRFANVQVQRLFEPACGTGRLMFRLAKAGFEVGGLDLNERAVNYCNDRLERHGYARSAFVADMTDFSLSRPVDCAFNMINSFRHLQTEAAAVAHLQCVSSALRRGGLYVLGLHLTPTEGEPTEEESWSARRGHLCVNTRLWTVARDDHQREERFQMTYDVYTPSKAFRIEDQIVFRTYTAEQFQSLLGEVGSLEIAGVFDFAYDLDHPLTLDAAAEDAVFVLRKR